MSAKSKKVRGWRVEILIESWQGGRPRPTSISEVPEELVRFARDFAEHDAVETVRIGNHANTIEEFTPKSNRHLASLVAERGAPKLAELIAADDTLAQEFRKVLAMPRGADGSGEFSLDARHG